MANQYVIKIQITKYHSEYYSVCKACTVLSRSLLPRRTFRDRATRSGFFFLPPRDVGRRFASPPVSPPPLSLSIPFIRLCRPYGSAEFHLTGSHMRETLPRTSKRYPSLFPSARGKCRMPRISLCACR